MKKLFQFGLLLAAFFALICRAGAEERITETRVVDARVVRIKLDGVIDLKLRQGDTPSLTITSDKRFTGKINATQTGDTLHLDTEGQGFKLNRSSVRAELTLPMLREVVSEGVGTTEISGFTGDELELTLDGAGSMKVAGDYKVLKANLGGVGSMHLWVSENDTVDLDLRGAGYITLGGRSKMLHATLGRPGRTECAAAAGGIDQPGVERPGQRHRQRQDQCHAQPERAGIGHRVRQAAQPQRQRRWPGQSKLEVNGVRRTSGRMIKQTHTHF
jgi:hypothetical protein